MELVYLWVEDYKNIKKQGFNFSPRFKCEYDEDTKELEVVDKEETKEPYLKNFFGDNINITAIVGENGSGKSSVLKSIFDLKRSIELKNKKRLSFTNSFPSFNSNLFPFPFNQDNVIENLVSSVDIFLVYFDYSRKKYFCYTNNNSLFFKINEKEDLLIDRIKGIQEFKGFYLNNATNILLSYKEKTSLTLLEQILQLLIKYDNFYTFYSKKYIFTKMTIKINRDKLFKNEFEDYEHKDFLNSLREKILNIIKENLPYRKYTGAFKRLKEEHYLECKSSTNFITDLKLSFIISFFNNLVDLFGNSGNIKGEFIKCNKNYFNGLSINNMLEKFTDFNEEINIHSLHCKQNKGLIKSFENLLEFFGMNGIENYSNFIAEKDIDEVEYFIIELDVKEDNKILRETLTQVLKFSDNNENNFINMFIIDFKNFDGTIKFEQLSDGEKAIFELFTKILYRVIFLDEKTLFLDEPETFLHPNWSISLINLLIKLINNLKLKDLNIIISTHSPFILSDLPKENVIFLEKGKQVYPFEDNQQTFGANIHTLLAHGFFMKDGLMGEFAKNKIDDVIKYINNKESQIKSDKDAQNIIDIIGEPIIKRELQRMLKNKMELSNKTEIDMIRKQIEELQIELAKKENKK